MLRPGLRLFALPAFMLALAACNHNPPPAPQPAPPPPNTTPENALRADLVLTRNGDFDGLLRSTLPPADYQAWREEWQHARAQQPAPTPEQRAHFAQLMEKLTAPGAEDKLLKQLAPHRAQLRTHRAQNLPMLIGILQATGNDLVQNADLSPDRKQQAMQAVAALAAWAQGTDFTDEAKAKQAIGVICATARKLKIQTLDQWRALDYPQVMARYGTGWNGLKQLLKIYGLDLDATFDSAKLETLSDDGTHARVRETLTLAGKPIVSEVHLVKQEGHWYDADALKAWRKQHQEPASSTAAGPSAASSAPAKASSAPAH
ncbi:MAG TPA: hypothetical protein VFP88_06270 [Rhodanobacteraceae bacterium]|nr:hypothetical protein [Rhodanobacteraceae bacterium]